MINDAIVEVLSDLSRQFRVELHHACLKTGSLLTPFQNAIIAYIGRNPSISIMELASLAGRDKAQITRVVLELETLDLVVRARSTQDRRSVNISLTNMGQELFQQVLDKRRYLASAMLGELRDDEKALLLTMLTTIRQSLPTSVADK